MNGRSLKEIIIAEVANKIEGIIDEV